MDIFVRILNPILMILFGLGAGIIVAKQRSVEWRLYGIGALTFIGSQVLHIPFNTWVLNPILQALPGNARYEEMVRIVAAIALGLSAGVFEETFRYLVYRFWIKGARQWKDALMFGAGHGGIEAMVLGVITLLTVINLIAIMDKDLSSLVPESQLSAAQAQISAFWAARWYEVLLGAGERLIALCFHVSASVLVLQVFRRRNILWLFAAIGLHALLDSLAVYGSQTWGMYVTEGVLAVFSIFCLAIIFWLKTDDESKDAVMPESPSFPELQKVEATTDQIEDSKYA